MSPLLAFLIMLFKADVFLTAAALLFATTPFFVTSIALLGTGSGVASLIFAPVFLIFVLFPETVLLIGRLAVGILLCRESVLEDTELLRAED